MNPRIRKLGQDSAKVAAAAAAGIASTAIVFLAGMFTESHLVTRELFASLQSSMVHHIAAATPPVKGQQ